MTRARAHQSAEGTELSGLQWLLDHHAAKESARRQMVADLHFKPGDWVLDIGCGPGLWTHLIAEQVQPHGHVTGADFSPQLLEYAQSNTANHPLRSHIEFRQADFNALPFDDDTFDATFFGNCLPYVIAPLRVLAEQKRVTKPGGRVIVKDYDGAIVYHPVDVRLSFKVLEAAARGTEDRPADQTFDNHVGRKMHGLLLQAGFQEVTTTTYAVQQTAPLSPGAERYLQGGGMWHIEAGADYLSDEDKQRWAAYFDPRSDAYILNREDFYFCMLEMVTIGIV